MDYTFQRRLLRTPPSFHAAIMSGGSPTPNRFKDQSISVVVTHEVQQKNKFLDPSEKSFEYHSLNQYNYQFSSNPWKDDSESGTNLVLKKVPYMSNTTSEYHMDFFDRQLGKEINRIQEEMARVDEEIKVYEQLTKEAEENKGNFWATKLKEGPKVAASQPELAHEDTEAVSQNLVGWIKALGRTSPKKKVPATPSQIYTKMLMTIQELKAERRRLSTSCQELRSKMSLVEYGRERAVIHHPSGRDNLPGWYAESLPTGYAEQWAIMYEMKCRRDDINKKWSSDIYKKEYENSFGKAMMNLMWKMEREGMRLYIVDGVYVWKRMSTHDGEDTSLLDGSDISLDGTDTNLLEGLDIELPDGTIMVRPKQEKAVLDEKKGGPVEVRFDPVMMKWVDDLFLEKLGKKIKELGYGKKTTDGAHLDVIEVYIPTGHPLTTTRLTDIFSNLIKGTNGLSGDGTSIQTYNPTKSPDETWFLDKKMRTLAGLQEPMNGIRFSDELTSREASAKDMISKFLNKASRAVGRNRSPPRDVDTTDRFTEVTSRESSPTREDESKTSKFVMKNQDPTKSPLFSTIPVLPLARTPSSPNLNLTKQPEFTRSSSIPQQPPRYRSTSVAANNTLERLLGPRPLPPNKLNRSSSSPEVHRPPIKRVGSESGGEKSEKPSLLSRIKEFSKESSKATFGLGLSTTDGGLKRSFSLRSMDKKSTSAGIFGSADKEETKRDSPKDQVKGPRELPTPSSSGSKSRRLSAPSRLSPPLPSTQLSPPGPSPLPGSVSPTGIPAPKRGSPQSLRRTTNTERRSSTRTTLTGPREQGSTSSKGDLDEKMGLGLDGKVVGGFGTRSKTE